MTMRDPGGSAGAGPWKSRTGPTAVTNGFPGARLHARCGGREAGARPEDDLQLERRPALSPQAWWLHELRAEGGAKMIAASSPAVIAAWGRRVGLPMFGAFGL